MLSNVKERAKAMRQAILEVAETPMPAPTPKIQYKIRPIPIRRPPRRTGYEPASGSGQTIEKGIPGTDEGQNQDKPRRLGTTEVAILQLQYLTAGLITNIPAPQSGEFEHDELVEKEGGEKDDSFEDIEAEDIDEDYDEVLDAEFDDDDEYIEETEGGFEIIDLDLYGCPDTIAAAADELSQTLEVFSLDYIEVDPSYGVDRVLIYRDQELFQACERYRIERGLKKWSFPDIAELLHFKEAEPYKAQHEELFQLLTGKSTTQVLREKTRPNTGAGLRGVVHLRRNEHRKKMKFTSKAHMSWSVD